MFGSDLLQVGGYRLVLPFPPPTQLTATTQLIYFILLHLTVVYTSLLVNGTLSIICTHPFHLYNLLFVEVLIKILLLFPMLLSFSSF